jgi:tripartite-type tricarboxylate transporter receptor subunit TctC
MTGSELVARAAPDGYTMIMVASTYASTSAYGKPSYDPVNDLAQELFKLETGIDLVHVPYKGAGPGLAALIAGEVQLTAVAMVPILPHVRAGRIRALAYTHPKRSSLLPDLPTMSESIPGFEVIHWYGIWGPKRLPAAIVTRWNAEVARILFSDDMRTRTRTEGLEPAGGPPEELGEVIRRDVEKWRRVMREAKLKRED